MDSLLLIFCLEILGTVSKLRNQLEIIYLGIDLGITYEKRLTIILPIIVDNFIGK